MPVSESSEDRAIPRGAVSPAFWRDRRVLVTGHTGFKGAWTALWLQSLGARVSGLSLGAPGPRSLYGLARVEEGMHDVFAGDICDPRAVSGAIASARPEIVVHMAAQPLVRRSYAQPRDTFNANVMGTVNVLDAVRLHEGVRAVVCVTSDKCYELREDERGAGERGPRGGLGDAREGEDRARGYREGDAMGGHDPYSASKGAAEIVVAAYRRSFFSDPAGPRVASARAGNVIGGGDWSEDRLVPDLMRAALAGETVRVRNPHAIRPWQHVLCPLGGYLVLAQALCESPEHARAWNFGPAEQDARTVGWIVCRVSELWPGGVRWTQDEGPHPHEAPALRLDSTQARERLGWRPIMGLEEAIEQTVRWYAALCDGADMRAVTLAQIESRDHDERRRRGVADRDSAVRRTGRRR